MVLEYMRGVDHLATRVNTLKRRDEFIQIQKNYITQIEKENVQLKESYKILSAMLEKKHADWHK